MGQGRLPEMAPPARRPARVCVVAYSFYAYDNRVRRYAEALTQRGDHVDVIALRRRGQPMVEIINGVRILQIQERTKNERRKLTYLCRLLLFFVRSMTLLTKRHFKNRYDLFHIHSVPDFLVFTAWIPKLMGAKVVLDIHDILPEFYASKFRISCESAIGQCLKRIERAATRFADHVIVSNHLWQEKLLARSIRSSAKCTTILNFPDPNIFARHNLARPGGTVVILYPGALNYHQGVDIAIRAFARIKDEAPCAMFYIHGEGDQKRDLSNLIEGLGLTNRVFLRDPVPLTEVAAIMERADIGVVPKRNDQFGNEAFSTKILEFMAVGVPVIVADTTIDRYYFDDSVVKFCRSGDEKDLAACMRQLITDVELRRRLAVRAEEFVARNSWAKKKADYLALVDAQLAAGDRLGS
jgi:glycosyltransferase involved in cell wall biosynthesis